jgi:hypothetical protein
MSDQEGDRSPSTSHPSNSLEAQSAEDLNQPDGDRTVAAQVVEEDLPSTAQGAAEHALDALSPAEQQGLAAAVVQTLNTPEQQKAAAEGVVGALPPEAKQDLAATVVQSLDTPQQKRRPPKARSGRYPPNSSNSSPTVCLEGRIERRGRSSSTSSSRR